MVLSRRVPVLLSLASASLPDPVKLQATLQEIAQKNADYYGCSVSIAVRDADSAVAAAAGIVDKSTGATAAIDDGYVWGSGIKPFTGASILKLIGEGKFGLEDKVSPLVDPFFAKLAKAHPEYNFSSMKDLWGENADNVTVHKLLDMKSGIPDFDTAHCHGHSGVCEDPLRAALYDHAEHFYSPMELMNFSWVRGQWVEDADTRFAYSSTNFMMLGMLLAEVSGASDWDRFDQGSFLPEELRERFQFAVKGSPEDYTRVRGYDQTTYNMNGTRTNDQDVGNVSGVFAGWTASDMIATPAAMADLAWAIYGPDSAIVPKEYAPLMQELEHYGVATFNMNDTTGQPKGNPYAWAYGHKGVTYGSESLMAYAPELGISMAVATNTESHFSKEQVGEPACFAYSAVASAILGQHIECSFPHESEGLGTWGRNCNCTAIEAPRVVV